MSVYNRSKRLERIIDNMTLPRVQMFFILAFTGAAGFAASVLLQEIVPSMTMRYPLVILISYAVFLLLLRIWISLHRNLGIDLESIPIDGGWPVGSSESAAEVFGGKGDFAGAGGGGQWSEPSGLSSARTGDGSAGLDVDMGGGLDLDDLAAILLAVVAIIAALVAILYVVYIAPVLLAEIFIDGVIVAGLYRSMRGVNQSHWLTTAVRKTIKPAILTAVLFSVAGFLFQKAVPEADTIGQVWTAIVG